MYSSRTTPFQNNNQNKETSPPELSTNSEINEPQEETQNEPELSTDSEISELQENTQNEPEFSTIKNNEEEIQKLKQEIQNLREQNANLSRIITSEKNKYRRKIEKLQQKLESSEPLQNADIMNTPIIPEKPFFIIMKLKDNENLLKLSHQSYNSFGVKFDFDTIDNEGSDEQLFQFVNESDFILIKSVYNTNLCFSISNSTKSYPPEGTPVCLSKTDGKSNQQFTYINGRIFSTQTGLCVAYDPNKDYPFVMMQPKDNNENQLFTIRYLD